MINILQFEEKCQGINYEYFGQEHSLVKMNNEMHRKIKAIMPARYRFIIQLSCIENDNQDVSMCSIYLWNDKLDTYVTSKFTNSALIIIAVCHLIYME